MSFVLIKCQYLGHVFNYLTLYLERLLSKINRWLKFAHGFLLIFFLLYNVCGTCSSSINQSLRALLLDLFERARSSAYFGVLLLQIFADLKIRVWERVPVYNDVGASLLLHWTLTTTSHLVSLWTLNRAAATQQFSLVSTLPKLSGCDSGFSTSYHFQCLKLLVELAVLCRRWCPPLRQVTTPTKRLSPPIMIISSLFCPCILKINKRFWNDLGRPIENEYVVYIGVCSRSLFSPAIIFRMTHVVVTRQDALIWRIWETSALSSIKRRPSFSRSVRSWGLKQRPTKRRKGS